MKITLKITALLLSAAAAISCLAACTKEDAAKDNSETATEQSAKAEKTTAANSPALTDGALTVAVFTAVAPYGYPDDNGYPDGFDISFANLLGAKLGVDTVIENVKGDELLTSFTSYIELAVCAIAKGAKGDGVAFSKPYYTAQQTVLVKSDSKISDTESLKGKTVGIRQGTEENYKQQKLTEVKQTSFSDLSLAVESLKAGTIDALIVDSNMAAGLTSGSNGLRTVKAIKFTDISYVVAMPEGDVALEKAVNDAIARIISDGELATIEKKYFG